MIRNVVVGRLTASDAPSRQQLQAGLEGIASLQLPGLAANHVGLDQHLRDGEWDFAITNDWESEEDYRHYDNDSEHNHFRAMIAAVCSDIARVQFFIG